MSWFDKIMPSRIKTERRTRSVPEGLWIKCPACDAVLYRAELERNLYVCPKCGHHMRMRARERLERFLDAGTSADIGAAISPEDPLKFRDSKRYRDRLAQAQKATGESDALVVLAGTLHTLPIVACAFEFQFLGGSMGSVVGERFKRGVDYFIQERRPVLGFSPNGGGAAAGRADPSPEPQVRCARSPSGSRCRSRCIPRASTWSSRASPPSRAPSASPSRHSRW